MSLSFYLNEINNNNKIHVQNNATFISKIDDFDVGTLAIEWNKTKNKIAPYTKLFIVDSTNNDTWCFVIISDNVEVVKKTKDVIYVHNLTVMQNTYEMTTQLVRNNIFTQPIAPKKSTIRATGFTIVNAKGGDGGLTFIQKQEVYLPYNNLSHSYIYSYEFTSVLKREKIKKAYIDISTITSAYRQCNIELSDIISTTPRAYKDNVYESITFIINKYTLNNILEDTLTVTATNGQKILELDRSFFVQERKYQLMFNDAQRPKIELFANPSDYDFLVNASIPTDEEWALPTIQTTFKCSLVIETYYYSLVDIIDILQNQTRKIYNGSATKQQIFDTLGSPATLYTTVAPDLTFSSENLWSCIADIAKYVDAIPAIDENGTLKLEYLNDYSRESINLKKVDEKSSLDNQYYTNSLVANYQNAKQENAIVYPGENIFRRVCSKTYGIPGKDDYEMVVPAPIDYIDKVLLKLSNAQLWDYELEFYTDAQLYNNYTKVYFDGKLQNSILDISDTIYEQSIYSLLPLGVETALNSNQLNSLYYSKGSKSIYLGGVRTDAEDFEYEAYKYAVSRTIKTMFGVVPSVYTNTTINESLLSNFNLFELQYSIKYHAVFDGRASQESLTNKYNGETYTTQEQGRVNLNRMGNNMQGLIAKLGNEIESVTIPVTDYGSRIKKGSLWVDDDGKKYIANVIKTTFSTSSDKVIVEAQFSRNFNLISQYTKVDQEKRFYEISQSIVNKGYENIVEYLYFSFTQRQSESVAYTGDMLDGIIKQTFVVNSEIKADIATIDTYEYQTDNTPSERDIYIPFHAYGLGNSICFEMGFDDALNAGDHIVSKDNKLSNEVKLYTVENGFADIVNLKMYARSSKESISLDDNFPKMTTALANISKKTLFDIQNYYYYKKPNEIFHLNYSIAFLPYPGEEIFFGDNFINRNAIIREMIDNNSDRKFYLYAGNEQYSIIDNKVLSTHTNYGLVTISYSQNSKYVTFTKNGAPVGSANAWAIADELGNILIAANQKVISQTTFTLYFATRRNRF